MTTPLSRRKILASVLSLTAALGVIASFWPSTTVAEDSDTRALAGKAAPDFALKTLDGRDATLGELKGKVVLVDFWATWCPPCVKGLPHINEIAGKKELAAKGLVVLAVNAREKQPKVSAFLESKGLGNLIVPMDVDGKMMDAYQVGPIPTTLIIGRDGKIQEVFIGLVNDATLNAAIEKALSAK